MPQKQKALKRSQRQQEQKKTAVETTACHPDRPVKTCYCTTDVQNLLLTYSDASSVSRCDLWSLPLAASLTSLEIASETTAFVELLTIIQDSESNTHTLKIQVESIACL